MKRWISLVFILILVWSMAAAANATGIDLTASAQVIAPGERVVVTVALKEEIPVDRGATVFQGVLTYNGEVLELESVEKGSADLTSAAKHAGEDKVIFHYMSTDSTAKAFTKGELIRLTFRAKEEISADHAACNIRFAAGVQNARGEDVGELEYPDRVSLVVATAHTWDEGTLTKAPTCVAEGEMTFRCTFKGCEATRTEAVEATGIHRWKEASCTEPQTCQDCGTTQGSALGHSWQPATATKAKTCGTCGITQGKPLGLSKPSVKAASDELTGIPTLSWSEVAEADGYRVYRSTGKKGKYELMGTVGDTSYGDTAAKVGKTYYYKVLAVYSPDEAANSGYSAVVSAKAKLPQPVITVTTDEATGKPVAAWEKVAGAKKYTVYRATSQTGKYSSVKTTSSLSYTDTKATVGKTYFYKVVAVASSGSYNSAASEIKSALTVCAQPKVTVKLDTATGKPVLRWAKVSGAVRYAVSYCDSPEGEYTTLEAQTAVSFTDTAAPVDKDRFYKVRALAADPACDSLEAEPVMGHAVPAQPTITAGTDALSGKPVVSWNAVEGAAEYRISRATKSGGKYTELYVTVDTSYEDMSASVGKTYYYKVTAVAAGSESALSGYKSGKCTCPQPAIQAQINAANGKPAISWEKVEGAKKYTVYRATSETGKYTSVKTVSSLSYTDTKATVGKTYFYKVVAQPASGSYKSAASGIESCLTVCAQPVVKLSLNSATGLPELSWGKVTGAVSYEIYRACGRNGSYELLSAQTGRSYKDTAAPVDTDCGYKVVAVAKDTAWNSLDGEPRVIHTACPKPIIKGKTDPVTGKPQITWECVDGAVSYEILRSSKSGSGYKLLDTDDDGNFIDTTAVKGKTYYYKVVAVCPNSRSSQSAYVKVKSK